jgi:hypothetical protein
MSAPLIVCSYGGGVQSTAILVLAAQGFLPYNTFLFANTGDDSEHPATLEYVRNIAFDYAAAHGIEMHELERTPKSGRHKGQPVTLRQAMFHPDSKSIPIPIRGENGAPGGRSCTADYKVRVGARWLREHGATATNPARVAIGISTDEYERATDKVEEAWERVEYPLLTLEHRLAGRFGASRNDCKRIIADAGLPIPPKSSCFFCPFHKPTVFADQARTEPGLFEQSCEIEEHINRDRAVGERLFLTRFGRPLREVFANVQGGLLDEWDEDEGYRCGDRCDT